MKESTCYALIDSMQTSANGDSTPVLDMEIFPDGHFVMQVPGIVDLEMGVLITLKHKAIHAHLQWNKTLPRH